VLRVRRCVPANADPCIPRGKLRQVRVRSVLDRLFHLLGPRGPAAVRVVQLAVQDSVTFRVA